MRKTGPKKKTHKPSPSKNSPKPNASKSAASSASAKIAAVSVAPPKEAPPQAEPAVKETPAVGVKACRAEEAAAPVVAAVEQQQQKQHATLSEKLATVPEKVEATVNNPMSKKKQKPNNKKKRLQEEKVLTAAQKVELESAAEPPLVESVIVASEAVVSGVVARDNKTDSEAAAPITLHPLVRSASELADCQKQLIGAILEKPAAEAAPEKETLPVVEKTPEETAPILLREECSAKKSAVVEKPEPEKTVAVAQKPTVEQASRAERASVTPPVKKSPPPADKTAVEIATQAATKPAASSIDAPVVESPNTSSTTSKSEPATSAAASASNAEHEKSQISCVSDVPSSDMSAVKDASHTTAFLQDTKSSAGDDKEALGQTGAGAAESGAAAIGESSEHSNSSEHGSGTSEVAYSRRYYPRHNAPYQRQDAIVETRQLQQQQHIELHRQHLQQQLQQHSHNAQQQAALHGGQQFGQQQQQQQQPQHQSRYLQHLQQQQMEVQQLEAQQHHQLNVQPSFAMLGQQRRREIRVEKDFIFTSIQKYTPRSELGALEAVDYRYDDSLTRAEALLLRRILNFIDFTGPAEYADQMALIIEIEDAFAQRDQWKHIKRQMAIVRKFRDNPATVCHEVVNIRHESIPCFVEVGDRVLLTSGCGQRFGNSIREHQRNQLASNVYATIVAKHDNAELCIAPNSPLCDGTDYTMQYVLNRMNYQLERFALQRVKELQLAPLLFPVMDQPLSAARAAQLPALQPIDRQLDDVQTLAVRAILAGWHHPRPFVLSGVAGAGKTRCMVEAILQLYRTQPDSKLLITSAANNILDELLLTLHASAAIPDAAFLRLNSATAGHTDSGDNPLHGLIDPLDDVRAQRLARLSTCVSKLNTPVIDAAVEEARLVLCTLSVCGRIAMSNAQLHNFTHIFMVKAEAANESMCLLPLCCLRGEQSRIEAHMILCGDTAQLGPIVKSPVAKRMHYGRSLLERLEGNPLYAAYDGILSVRLRRNYRSLPELLELPNMLSYKGQMEAGVNYAERMKLDSHITLAGYPIMFHSVENGQPVREPRSCSWSNVNEANIVIAYVYYYMDLGVSVDDIGIITPYKQQMRMIQKGIVDFAAAPNRSGLRIGSSEEFQGREKKIVIVSTVRNNKLGFINSRKRINHMLTRATSLLIIVGNGEFLRNDTSPENDWKEVIQHCMRHEGAYISTK